jgi:hypothetical protein
MQTNRKGDTGEMLFFPIESQDKRFTLRTALMKTCPLLNKIPGNPHPM